MATAKPMKTPVMPKGPMRGRGMPVPKGAIKKGTLPRLLKMVFRQKQLAAQTARLIRFTLFQMVLSSLKAKNIL